MEEDHNGGGRADIVEQRIAPHCACHSDRSTEDDGNNGRRDGEEECGAQVITDDR